MRCLALFAPLGLLACAPVPDLFFESEDASMPDARLPSDAGDASVSDACTGEGLRCAPDTTALCRAGLSTECEECIARSDDCCATVDTCLKNAECARILPCFHKCAMAGGSTNACRASCRVSDAGAAALGTIAACIPPGCRVRCCNKTCT